MERLLRKSQMAPLSCKLLSLSQFYLWFGKPPDFQLDEPSNQTMEKAYEEYSGYSFDQLRSELNAIHVDLEYFTKLYDAYCQKSSFAEAMIDSKTKHFNAQNELVEMIQKQIELNESLCKECCNIAEKSALDQHRGNLVLFLRSHQKMQEDWDKKLKQLRAQLKQTERELNIEVKPNLANLTHRKRIIFRILNDRGINHDVISQMDVTDSTCENDALSLRESAWLMEKCTRDEAVELLRNKPTGTFLIRPSSSTPYALSIVVNGKVHHCRIIHDDNFYGFSDPCIVHPDLRSLVRHYRHNSLEVHNPVLKSTYLTYPLNLDQVTNPQTRSDLFNNSR